MAEFTAQAQALEIQLAQLGRDFLCTSQLPDTAVQLRFLGPFQGRNVVWDMRLATLAAWRSDGGAQAAVPCPFIDIAAGHAGVYPIAVGLDLPVIDEPVIRKAIIMVRNYKRLVIGRIEFCPPVADN